MIVLPADATDEQIKQLVIDWIAVVAEERYDEALGMLYQGNINPFWDSADPDGQRWTSELLQLVLTTYGVFDLQFDEGYRMDRVTELRQDTFSRQFEQRHLPTESTRERHYRAARARTHTRQVSNAAAERHRFHRIDR